MYKKIAMAILLIAFAFSIALASKPKSRDFEFTYSFVITDIPDNAKKVEFWVPVPQDAEYQKITDVIINTKVEYSISSDGSYQNKMLHANITPDGASEIPVSFSFKVKRNEMAGLQKTAPANKINTDVYLKPSRLAVINDDIKKISANLTKGKSGTVEKARAIYDYVLDNMSYDKSGEGWGRGDTAYACDVAKGNCTDFHSLFMSLVRAAGIPARFKIGFPLPADKDSGTIGGYHCWAEFYDDEHGWVPVDASEAKKNPEKKEYFFGNVCENRVELSVGRDLTLSPKQAGEKLNFFIYPYVEVDGFVHTTIKKDFSYKNL